MPEFESVKRIGGGPESRVKVAVLPAAGAGTRMAPASRYIPKELFPLGPYPVIQWSLEEIFEAGIRRESRVDCRPERVQR